METLNRPAGANRWIKGSNPGTDKGLSVIASVKDLLRSPCLEKLYFSSFIHLNETLQCSIWQPSMLSMCLTLYQRSIL